MTNNQNQPRDYDAVLGGQSPPPIDGLVLGGIEGIKRCLSNPVANVRIAALGEALKYGDAGLDVLIQALQDKSRLVQRFAYRVLKQRTEPQVLQALQIYKSWNLEERFNKYPMDASAFLNRQIVDFDPNVGIAEPINNAYALRCEYDDNEENFSNQLSRLVQQPNADKLEALVFGLWPSQCVRKLFV
ncbi:HEAT repeat domain-containing protein [uncultured Nostoc sp.]|uniref:HEAT repeat domain-containing protein n=1 Tax=uncultured Nostoc sp. TaxID=340711 RepID=UPI0035CAB96F